MTEDDLVESYRAAWQEALDMEPGIMRDMVLGSLRASVSPWGNALDIEAQRLWKEYDDSGAV